MYIELKEKAFKCVEWHENFAEMKNFCGDACKIEYKSCCLDDYWDLEIYDCIKDKKLSVAQGDYVVRIGDDKFTAVKRVDFDTWFEEISEKEYEEKQPKSPDETNISEGELIYKNPTAYKAENAIDPIPVNSKVLIKGTKHIQDNVKYLFEGKVGEVIAHWTGNIYGEYNVKVSGGFNDCFDRDELEVIETPITNCNTIRFA